MWKWIWPTVGSNPISQNTDSEMFDRSDYPYTETFVREAIQNTLDAILDKSHPAVISFRFHAASVHGVKPLIGAAIELRSKAGVVVPAEWTSGQVNWLTIEDFNPGGRFAKVCCASLLRLKGCWLKQAGFHSGAQVTVSNPSPGVIELRVCSPVQIDASYFTALNQLNAVLHENPESPRTVGPL